MQHLVVMFALSNNELLFRLLRRQDLWRGKGGSGGGDDEMTARDWCWFHKRWWLAVKIYSLRIADPVSLQGRKTDSCALCQFLRFIRSCHTLESVAPCPRHESADKPESTG